MGTRNLIIIYYKGQYVVAQYAQWDGYPEGQGATIHKFFSEDPKNLQALKDKLHVVYEMPPDELKRVYEEAEQRDRQTRNVSMTSSLQQQYPSLSRNTGANILDLIVQARTEDKIPVELELDFIADYLFCEWAYVIDLDTDKLEVYSGSEDKEGARSKRFADLWANDEKHHNEKLAQLVDVPRMLGDFSLTKLPELGQFVAYFNEVAGQYED